MNTKGLFSSNSDEWATPSYIYRQVQELGLYDPCPLGGTIDALLMDWGSNNFVNPPYSQLKKWVNKCIEQHRKGKEILLLIPCRSDNKAFKALFDYGVKITFITSRLHYNDSRNACPFPSILVKFIGGGLLIPFVKGLMQRTSILRRC